MTSSAAEGFGVGEKADDDDMVHCDRHGAQPMAFVCQHLLTGSGLGFCHSGGPQPSAWCGDCDALMMQTGHWTEEAEAVAGITIVCHRCLDNIRRRNRVRREWASDAEPGAAAESGGKLENELTLIFLHQEYFSTERRRPVISRSNAG